MEYRPCPVSTTVTLHVFQHYEFWCKVLDCLGLGDFGLVVFCGLFGWFFVVVLLGFFGWLFWLILGFFLWDMNNF